MGAPADARRESLTGFREALAAASVPDVVLSRAMVGLIMRQLLDPAIPEVRAVLEESRATYARLRARPWLERIDALLGPARDTGPERPAVVATAPATSAGAQR